MYGRKARNLMTDFYGLVHDGGLERNELEKMNPNKWRDKRVTFKKPPPIAKYEIYSKVG